jgi:hypothetical protein
VVTWEGKVKEEGNNQKGQGESKKADRTLTVGGCGVLSLFLQKKGDKSLNGFKRNQFVNKFTYNYL